MPPSRLLPSPALVSVEMAGGLECHHGEILAGHGSAKLDGVTNLGNGQRSRKVRNANPTNTRREVRAMPWRKKTASGTEPGECVRPGSRRRIGTSYRGWQAGGKPAVRKNLGRRNAA